MRVALGEEPADLVVLNADLVNVYTGEIQKNMGIAVKGRWIARVSAEVKDTVGPATRVLDASGRTLVPGLIDGHTHLAWIYTAAEFIPFASRRRRHHRRHRNPRALPGGRVAGVLDFLDSFREQPIRILATAPAMVSISSAAKGDFCRRPGLLLERDDVLGLGESYWQAVLQEPETYLPLFQQTHRSGKVLEGHSAGASEKKLAAYVAAGVTSCHEPIDAEQVLARLRLGVHVMVREGSIRRDLEAISRIRSVRHRPAAADPGQRRRLTAGPDAGQVHGFRGPQGDGLRVHAGRGDPDGHSQRGRALPPGRNPGRHCARTIGGHGAPPGSDRVQARDGRLQRRGHRRRRPAPQGAPAACLFRGRA